MMKQMTREKLVHRILLSLFPGQMALLDAEAKRRGVSRAVIARELFDIAIPKYRSMHKLPPTYPDSLDTDES